MTLADALRMTADESVALVGGGGKTTAMFRLAREVVDRGGRAITTTTTRIFGAQIALAPAHVPAADATRERVAAALAAHGHVLVIGPTEAGQRQGRGRLPRSLPAPARVVPGRLPPERGRRLAHAPLQGSRRATSR